MKPLRTAKALALAAWPLMIGAACAVSNGTAVPPEVRDAGELQPDPDPEVPGADGGSGKDAGKDSGAKDASADADGGAAAPKIVIQEIYVDDVGMGDNVEYVELRAPPGTSLDGLMLRSIYGNGQIKYELDAASPGDVFPATGVWVVGGALANVDHSVSLSSWGLDNRGAIQLVRGPQKTLLDVVGWTDDPDAGALVATGSPPTATAEGKPALMPTTSPRAIGRKQGAVDTNDNRADFCVMPKSPRAAQQADCDP